MRLMTQAGKRRQSSTGDFTAGPAMLRTPISQNDTIIIIIIIIIICRDWLDATLTVTLTVKL